MNIPKFIQKIDWSLLREQKETLLNVINETSDNYQKCDLEGILLTIDALQDYAVDELSISEIVVFDINGEEKRKYYQPEFEPDETLITPEGVELWSYYVYAKKENAQRDFPDREILEYSGDDIENPYFVDGDGEYY